MREKLKELSEILKQDTVIKERLERLEFGCYLDAGNWYFQIINSYEKDKLRCYDILDKRYVVYKKNEFYFWDDWLVIIGREPSYSDILEYLGGDYFQDKNNIYFEQYVLLRIVVNLSPWPLSEQTDETLDNIISLCKNQK